MVSVNFLFKFMFLLCILDMRVTGYMDFYLPQDEVYKLFGIQDGQLYYMHDGQINKNALSFMARIQPDHNLLKYSWHKTSTDISIAYNINFNIFNSTGFNHDVDLRSFQKANVKQNGFMLQVPNNFEILLNCPKADSGNVSFITKFSFHWSVGKTSFIQNVTIRRLKLCRRNQSLSEDLNVVGSYEENIVTENPSVSIQPGGSQQSTNAFFISIGTVVLFIVVIFIVCCWWHIRMNRKHGSPRHNNFSHLHLGPHNANQFLRLDVPNNVQQTPSHSSLVQFTPFINNLGSDINEIRGKLSDISLPRVNVILGDLLLKGTFARIYKGTTEDGSTVLIKAVTDNATEEQQRLLLFESSLLRGLHHRNLLAMKHVVLDASPMVLFSFKEGGNLKHFLQSLKVNEDSAPGLFGSNLLKFNQLSTQDLLEMAIQVACGMTYLSKRGVVHKDLAARNCMVDDDLRIKITDYALSRDVFPQDYCCLGDYENRPVRWLALESLVHKWYSSGSDVWSFGVLLWELQSLAATPYTDIDDFEMADYLSDGFRLSQPINCPDRLYDIMAGCWHYSPDQRPIFTHLLQLLTEFNAELVDYV